MRKKMFEIRKVSLFLHVIERPLEGQNCSKKLYKGRFANCAGRSRFLFLLASPGITEAKRAGTRLYISSYNDPDINYTKAGFILRIIFTHSDVTKHQVFDWGGRSKDFYLDYIFNVKSCKL